MRLDFGADPVFERSDDLPARRVVLGIGGKHEEDVQRQADGVPLHLHVTLLEDVEEADLNLPRKIG